MSKLSATAPDTRRPPGSEFHRYLMGRKDDFVKFLEQLTLVESPSLVAETQVHAREIIAKRLEALEYRTLKLTGRLHGGHLFARPNNYTSQAPVQLLIGHYDTVWPVGTLSHMPFSVDGNTVSGPGVYDMKGGITQIIFALEILSHFGVTPSVTPVIFANSDEEIGSRESTRHIRRLAQQSCRAFVMEPSLGQEGKLKTTRKGVGRFTITIKGKAAHAGLDPGKGASAILELSHVVQQLFALNDANKGITVNVGTIEGGSRANVIASESGAVVDVRVCTAEDAEYVSRAIHELQPSVAGTSLLIEGRIGRPALESTARNQRLWNLAKNLSKELGLELSEALAGGGSDGNTTSQYTATLDGLGPVGDGAHATHECLYLDETLQRTVLLALLISSPELSNENL